MRSIYSFLGLRCQKFIYNLTYRVIIALFFIVSPLSFFRRMFLRSTTPINSSRVFRIPNSVGLSGYAELDWLVSFLLGFIAIYIVTSEVSYRTLRQNILTGLSRKGVLCVEILRVVFLSFVAMLLYIISTVVMGLIHTESPRFRTHFDNNFAIVRYFFMCLGYMTFGLFAGFFN